MSDPPPTTANPIPFNPTTEKRFYKPIEQIPDWGRNILETYSKIPSDEVLPHVRAVRDRAFDVFPWPCLGMGSFMNPTFRGLPGYDAILTRLKEDSSTRFLDIGCGLGQELRGLVMEGVNAEQIWGGDLNKEFLGFGEELFHDKGRFEGRLVSGDILKEGDYAVLDGKMDVILTANFFHVFKRENMKKAMKRVVQFLRDREGGVIIGRQIATAGEAREVGHEEFRIWVHNARSMADMCREVGEEMGVKWKRVEVEEFEYPERVKKAGDWPLDDLVGIKFVLETA